MAHCGPFPPGIGSVVRQTPESQTLSPVMQKVDDPQLIQGLLDVNVHNRSAVQEPFR